MSVCVAVLFKWLKDSKNSACRVRSFRLVCPHTRHVLTVVLKFGEIFVVSGISGLGYWKSVLWTLRSDGGNLRSSVLHSVCILYCTIEWSAVSCAISRVSFTRIGKTRTFAYACWLLGGSATSVKMAHQTLLLLLLLLLLVMFNDVDFFRNPITLLKQILNWNLLYWVIIIITIIIAVIYVHSK